MLQVRPDLPTAVRLPELTVQVWVRQSIEVLEKDGRKDR